MSLLDNNILEETKLDFEAGFPIIGYKTNAIVGAGIGFHWKNKNFFSGTVYENEFAIYIKQDFSYRDFDIYINTWKVSFYCKKENGGYYNTRSFNIESIIDNHTAIRSLYLFLELIKDKKIQENENLLEYGDYNLKEIYKSLIIKAEEIERYYKETDPWCGWKED